MGDVYDVVSCNRNRVSGETWTTASSAIFIAPKIWKSTVPKLKMVILIGTPERTWSGAIHIPRLLASVGNPEMYPTVPAWSCICIPSGNVIRWYGGSTVCKWGSVNNVAVLRSVCIWGGTISLWCLKTVHGSTRSGCKKTGSPSSVNNIRVI